jgi:hypothetical protein
MQRKRVLEISMQWAAVPQPLISRFANANEINGDPAQMRWRPARLITGRVPNNCSCENIELDCSSAGVAHRHDYCTKPKAMSTQSRQWNMPPYRFHLHFPVQRVFVERSIVSIFRRGFCLGHCLPTLLPLPRYDCLPSSSWNNCRPFLV